MNEDIYQEEQYSSDVSEHSISNNVLSVPPKEEKEKSPISSSSKSNSSKVEKVCITCY